MFKQFMNASMFYASGSKIFLKYAPWHISKQELNPNEKFKLFILLQCIQWFTGKQRLLNKELMRSLNNYDEGCESVILYFINNWILNMNNAGV